MKVREVMTPNPVVCLSEDSAQKVAVMMRENNIGSVPVVADRQSRTLLGVITDRDIAIKIVADGLDPRKTPIEKHITLNPVTCRDGENLEKCEKAMQEHQIRRILIVDAENKVIGIVAQADLALKEKPEKVASTVGEISKPESDSTKIAA
jgi:CBS domain-containing protein